MLLSDINSMANSDGLASPDIDLKRELLFWAIPKYLLDIDQRVGKVYWRRKLATITIAANDREKNLASDFGRMDRIIVTSTNGKGHEFHPLDSNNDEVLYSELNTDAGLPSQYHIKWGTAGLHTIRFSQPFNGAYTLSYLYYTDLGLSPDTPNEDETDVTDEDYDLTTLIPLKFQSPLVLLMRARIYELRHDAGDKRFKEKMKEYDDLLDSYRITWRTAINRFSDLRMA